MTNPLSLGVSTNKGIPSYYYLNLLSNHFYILYNGILFSDNTNSSGQKNPCKTGTGTESQYRKRRKESQISI